ncbi:unnamed protein product [Caenorhabditis angaria]|uniref:Uncharacterized protein n=1 Tax=Caenorhabditis angaria TaxID=860376 RepID=A0A9P1N5L0_9PELO|nr:unnamed protein product [Caenorhabditis angaria]
MNSMTTFLLISLICFSFIICDESLTAYESIKNLKECLDMVKDPKNREVCAGKMGPERDECVQQYTKKMMPKINKCVEKSRKKTKAFARDEL